MLTKEEIKINENKFKDIVCSINRLNDDDVARILDCLDKSDFFIAPASTKYHNTYEGGLCEHSLSVYDNLIKLYETFKFELDEDDLDSLKVVSLFHDIGKVNFYVKEVKHKKVVNQDGSFRWEDYIGYSYKDIDNRFFVGNHEETCAYIVSTLMPLRASEYSAILNHHGGLDWSSTKQGPTDVYCKYPLAMFLHFADTAAAYDKSVR